MPARSNTRRFRHSGRRAFLALRARRTAFLLLLVSACGPVLVRGQFQDPTPDELKMASDPKAPGAAAVYLYREEIVDDARGFESTYERIKVLGEKGLDLATVRLPYAVGFDDKPEIQARTIHPDGKVVPFTEKPSELVDMKGKNFQVNSRVVTLPDVEVGSVLEFRIRTRRGMFSPPPLWEIQQSCFVHKAHYYFNAGSFLHPAFEAMIGSGEKVIVDKKGGYTLDLTDIPPLPDEEQMPPLNLLQWRVHFYYTEFSTTAAFWDNAAQVWGKNAGEFTKPTATLKKAVDGIVSAGDPDEIRAQKIYAAVMALENTDFGREKSHVERKKEKLKDVRTLDDIWNQKSGPSDAIALLYVAMCRAAGLSVWPMVVVDRNRALFDHGYLNSRQFDDYIAIAGLNGKEIYLDPGEKMCPFGALHWRHTLTTGFRLTPTGGVLAGTPAADYKAAALSRTAVLNLDDQGNIKGTARFVMSGPPALYWRQETLRNDTEEVKKEFNDSIRESFPDGVLAEFDHFLGLEEYPVNLVAIIKVSGSLGAMTGKRLILPGLFFESHAGHPFVSAEKRVTPIDMHYAQETEDDVTYYLPPGFDVESMPAKADISWPDMALLRIESTAKDRTVRVGRTLACSFAMLAPNEYPDLHGFYQKVATADQQQIVLARTVAAKGN